jgi:hypothetical protein
MNAVAVKKEVPRTLDLRDKLKEIVDAEIERLPGLLETLSDSDRLSVILKLMPLVMPRSKPVHHAANELPGW